MDTLSQYREKVEELLREWRLESLMRMGTFASKRFSIGNRTDTS